MQVPFWICRLVLTCCLLVTKTELGSWAHIWRAERGCWWPGTGLLLPFLSTELSAWIHKTAWCMFCLTYSGAAILIVAALRAAKVRSGIEYYTCVHSLCWWPIA